MNISKADNIVLNLGSGLLPKDLSEDECICLEQAHGKDWFEKLGYTKDKYELPQSLKNDFVFDSEMKRKILREIGLFFFEKNDWNEPKTVQEIYYIEFHELKFEKCLIVVCGQPGRLIGPKGQTINDLSKHLVNFYEKENIKIPSVDINVEENRIITNLFAFQTRY